MHIEVIRSVEDWSALEPEWQALVKSSHQNTPFITYEFQRAWWQHLGGGEWQEAQLNILAGRAEDGSLLGLAPLSLVRDKDGVSTLQFIGSHEIADFLDFIARPEDLSDFLQAIFIYLGDLSAHDWQRLDLYNLVDSSASQVALEQAAKQAGWDYQLETLQPSPYLEIPASLEAYGEMLGSKQAHELRRKMRRAARNPEPVVMEIVHDADDLPQCLEDFFALMSQEVDKERFLSPAMRTQMDAIAQAACEAGWLQIPFLKVGDQRVAAYMNFDYNGRIWAYNSGFSNDFSQLSPGWLIMADMVQWCIDNSRQAFDFMRGDEEYKYRFGATDRYVQRVTVTRK